MESTQLTIQEILAEYFDASALRLPPETLYRLEGAGLRSYYTYTPPVATKPKKGRVKKGVTPPAQPRGEVKFYISFTSLLHATLPTPPQLIQWMQKNGEQSEELKNERADYGTLMHITFERVLLALINRAKYNIDELPAEVLQYIEERDLQNIDWIKWLEDLKQDVLGFAQFITDYKVRPVAIEIPLKCDKYRVAGVLDLSCYMTIKEKGFWGEVYKSGERKGEPKETSKDMEVFAIVDFKSSRKGCYEENELQLKLHEIAWRENFPDFKDATIKLFNLRPKDWRTEPSYSLHDQTGKHDEREVALLADIYHHRNNTGAGERTLIGGVLDFTSGACDVSACYTRVSMENYILNKREEKK